MSKNRKIRTVKFFLLVCITIIIIIIPTPMPCTKHMKTLEILCVFWGVFVSIHFDGIKTLCYVFTWCNTDALLCSSHGFLSYDCSINLAIQQSIAYWQSKNIRYSYNEQWATVTQNMYTQSLYDYHVLCLFFYLVGWNSPETVEAAFIHNLNLSNSAMIVIALDFMCDRSPVFREFSFIFASLFWICLSFHNSSLSRTVNEQWPK